MASPHLASHQQGWIEKEDHRTGLRSRSKNRSTTILAYHHSQTKRTKYSCHPSLGRTAGTCVWTLTEWTQASGRMEQPSWEACPTSMLTEAIAGGAWEAQLLECQTLPDINSHSPINTQGRTVTTTTREVDSLLMKDTWIRTTSQLQRLVVLLVFSWDKISTLMQCLQGHLGLRTTCQVHHIEGTMLQVCSELCQEYVIAFFQWRPYDRSK